MEIRGKTHAYAETGTEGVFWAIVEHNVTGYEGLYLLEDGDYLTLFADKNQERVIFSGFIKQDKTTNLHSRPFNPEYRQQIALGMWVHWIQNGWQPDDWARLFVRGNYYAKLLRKERDPLQLR